MLRWIQQRSWLPEILLAAGVFLVLGGSDLLAQGIWAMLATFFIAVSFLFVRQYAFVATGFLVVAAFIQVFLELLPVFGNLGLVLLAFVIGAFGTRPWREINVATSFFALLAVISSLSFNLDLALGSIGLIQVTDVGRAWLFVVLVFLALTLLLLASLLGQLLITRLVHVGTDFDRLVYEERQVKLSIELAEQAKRFEIARDINEHIVQRVSAVISNAEGGSYAAKNDPQAAARALDKVLLSARAAHSELRRLFDMLNRGTVAASAPPKLEDLATLAVSMREGGLDVEVVHFGNPFPLTAAAELTIYRIVFDALQNVKQHTPRGTKATVEFSWLEDSLQIMIKDNGVEVTRRATLDVQGLPEPYTAQEDLDTLLEKVTGPGLTAMRERAESFGGSLEVNRVVGIGFTVSAMFPGIEVRAEAQP